MQVNSCCCVWNDLSQELAELKTASLDKLLKRGIPRSTFSPVFRILENLKNYCPMCGSRITTAEVPQQKQERVQEPKKSAVPDKIKCPPCRGTGYVGSGLKCMTCLGDGTLDKSNPMRLKFDANYAKEIAEKMDDTNRRIVQKEAEIQKNPQPLRDDAKPENWGR